MSGSSSSFYLRACAMRKKQIVMSSHGVGAGAVAELKGLSKYIAP